MKKFFLKLAVVLGAVLMVGVSVANAQTYGSTRIRSIVDSTGLQRTLIGVPPAPPAADSLSSALPGSHCGWLVRHQGSGDFSPSLPCNGQMIPMGVVYQCSPGLSYYTFDPMGSGVVNACANYSMVCYVTAEGANECGYTADVFEPPISQTYAAVGNESQVSFYNCPAGWPLTFLNYPDGKFEYTCMKS